MKKKLVALVVCVMMLMPMFAAPAMAASVTSYDSEQVAPRVVITLEKTVLERYLDLSYAPSSIQWSGEIQGVYCSGTLYLQRGSSFDFGEGYWICVYSGTVFGNT